MELTLPELETPKDARRRGAFFVVWSAAMLAGVFLGFARTFYFRSLFVTPDLLGGRGLPWHLHLHGLVMSSWFILVLVQAVLIRKNQTATHRRVGLLGAALAAAVVLSGVYTITSFVPRASLSGFDPVMARRIVVGDLLGMTLFFPIIVSAGVLLRRDSETHKRLMSLSCVLLWMPVFARYVQMLEVLRWPAWLALAFTPLTWVLALLGYDLVKRRRPHIATVLGSLFIILKFPLDMAVSESAPAHAFIRWLGWPLL